MVVYWRSLDPPALFYLGLLPSHHPLSLLLLRCVLSHGTWCGCAILGDRTSQPVAICLYGHHVFLAFSSQNFLLTPLVINLEEHLFIASSSIDPCDVLNMMSFINEALILTPSLCLLFRYSARCKFLFEISSVSNVSKTHLYYVSCFNLLPCTLSFLGGTKCIFNVSGNMCSNVT
jgi:hypothetical protein